MDERDIVNREYFISKYVNAGPYLDVDDGDDDDEYVFTDKYLDEWNDIKADRELLIERFFKGKTRIERRNRIIKMNTAKRLFMFHLGVCEDVKRHIYSFL